MTTRALFVCLDTLGDLTLRQPLFSAVLDAGFDVTVAVRHAYAPLVPFLDRRLAVLSTDVDPYRAPDDALARLQRLAADIHAAAPGLVVLSAYSRTYADEWLLRHPGGPRRAGFERPAAAIVLDTLRRVAPGLDLDAPAALSPAVVVAEDAHELAKNAALAEAVVGHAPAAAEPRLSLDAALLARADAFLRTLGLAPGRFVLGCPGGTANNPSKGWPPAGFAELTAHLHRRHGLPVLLTGLPGEAERMEDVARRAAQMDVPVARHVGDPDDLPLLLGLVAHSRLYLGVDTGPMHFAGALDVPVVALFGGGHWGRFLPRARRSFVATQQMPCFGCGWDCWLSEPACITAVSTADVRAGIDWILGDAPDERRVHTGAPVAPLVERLVDGARAARETTLLALQQARSDADARLGIMATLGAQLKDTHDALEVQAAALRRAHEDVLQLHEAVQERDRGAAALALRLRDTEADSTQRLRNMEELERVIAGLRATVEEQRRELARPSVRLVRKLRLP